MYHSFDVDVAKEYGVDEAIMICHFQFWISHNAANRRHEHNGRVWTYNTYDAFSKLFPYYSPKQIRRILSSLISQNIILVGCYNQKGYDKTNWYSFIEQEKWIVIPYKKATAQTGKGKQNPLPETVDHDPNSFNGATQTGRPIPVTLPINNTNTLSSPNGDEAGAKNPPSDQAGANPAGGQKEKKSPGQKKKKDPAEATEHWQALVDVWHVFYKDKKGMDPTFGGQEGKQLKEISTRLHKRATDRGKAWDEQSAKDTLSQFLKYAYQIQWLSDNFLLSNLLKQFDKIISDAINNRQPQQPNGNNAKGQQPISLASVYQKLS